MNNYNPREFMRILLMYDLPSISSFDHHQYSKFHRFIVKNGYDMINFSVYVKVTKSLFEANKQITYLKKNLPNQGNIRVLTLTNKQYENMLILQGEQTIKEKYVGHKNLIILDDDYD